MFNHTGGTITELVFWDQALVMVLWPIIFHRMRNDGIYPPSVPTALAVSLVLAEFWPITSIAALWMGL